MIMKDTPLISKQKQIFNELVDKRFEEITNLNEKVNSDDLIYNTTDAKFDQLNNAFNL